MSLSLCESSASPGTCRLLNRSAEKLCAEGHRRERVALLDSLARSPPISRPKLSDRGISSGLALAGSKNPRICISFGLAGSSFTASLQLCGSSRLRKPATVPTLPQEGRTRV